MGLYIFVLATVAVVGFYYLGDELVAKITGKPSTMDRVAEERAE